MDNRRRFVFATGLTAAVWVVASFAAPETNFFLFPLLVGGITPVAQRLDGQRTYSQAEAGAAAVTGFVTGAFTTGLLALAGRLEGEPLGFLGPIALEGVLLSLIGAVVGAAVGRVSTEAE